MFEDISNLSIENVVATATLDHGIDLAGIKKVLKNVDYRPKRFPGLIYRRKHPKTSILIFNSGKMVCTGSKSEKQAKSSINRVIKLLKKGGIIILSRPRIEIVNIVASGDLGVKVDLEAAADLMGNVLYEPEMFPGLIYRMSNPKTVLLVFASGKIVCTGAKKEKQVFKSVEKISSIIEEKELFYST